jgi:lipoprotein-releasing system permease protein
MFRPAAFFIGLRYTRAKSRNQFISLISCISIFGIALGVSVLITVLSVVNGFDREIKKQIFDMISPITITNYTGPINHWQQLETRIKTNPHVKGMAPYISEQAMLSNADFTLPTMLIGILPEQENSVSALSKKMIRGSLLNLRGGEAGIVIGKSIAEKLNVNVGDKIIIATLQGAVSTTNITPQFKRFTIAGIFSAGGGGLSFDSRMAFIHLQDAQQLLSLGSGISGLHINVDNVYSAPLIAHELLKQLPPEISAWDWTGQLGDFFENIRMTKTMMFFIFVLIIAVATFNLICTMVMVVKNKESDIAILRTLGATPFMIIMIFTVQGLLTALGGTILGILGGVALALNVPALSTWIQDVSHTQLVSSNVYFVNYLPSDLQWHDVWFISVIALILSLISSLYPAWKASRVTLVEALNNE